MKIPIYIGLLIIPCLIVVACSNQDSANQSSAKNTARVPGMQNAKLLFEVRCAACHGNNGKGGIGNVPDLQASESDSIAIFQTIQKGKDNMPSFKTVITENEMRLLAEYVYHLKTNKK